MCSLLTGDDVLVMKAIRCLGLLLIPMKTKHAEGDIPFVMRFVPVSVEAYICTLIVHSHSLIDVEWYPSIRGSG